MKSKIILTIPITTFSIPFLCVAMSNKVRGHTVIKALGITAFAILILMSVAGASPFAYVTNSGDDSTNFVGTVSVIDTSTNKVTATVKVGIMPAVVAALPDGTKVMWRTQAYATLLL
jgi:YVTN family beta-propeller protein